MKRKNPLFRHLSHKLPPASGANELPQSITSTRDAVAGGAALREGLAGVLAVTSAKAAGHTVESYLITSTGHVTAAERDLFDAGKTPAPWMVVSLSGDYGWLIHLSDALPESIPGLSDGLAAVIQHARAHGLHYIRFDADGPDIEGAPTYEW